jgi:pyrroline-5-carboxylate reductase
MKIGIIGCGNLGGSLLKGLLKAGAVKADKIIAADVDGKKLEPLRKLGVETTSDNKKAADADVILIAVKPGLVGEALDELKLSDDKLLISLSAGVTIKTLEGHTDARVIRVMPNICGLVAEMASCYSLGTKASKSDEEVVNKLLGSLGVTFNVEEGLMDAVTGLSGSGPAYFYTFIKALKEEGVRLGLPEDVALKLAAQTAKGAGETALSSGKDLGELTDMVCSPKGTTIEGLKVLENEKVAEALKNAMRAAVKRSRELSQ